MRLSILGAARAGVVSLWFVTASLAQSPPIQITDAWARATPAKAETGAAYLTIVSTTPDRLIGISTPVAAKAELHRMTMTGNVMQMRPVDALDLKADAPVTLKPGGLHIMLTGLKRRLNPGDRFKLQLDFAKAGPREVIVGVEGIGAMGPPGGAATPATPSHMPDHQ